MTFGFKSVNDAGTNQIDDTYKGLEMRASGTINTSSLSGGISFLSYGSFTLDLTYPPVIAFKDGTGFTCNNGISSVYLGGGITRYTIGILVFKPSSTHYAVTYFVFGPPRTISEVPLPQIGLVVYNSSGAITYRSDQKYFNIVDVVSLASPTNELETSTTRTYTSGRSYAVASTAISNYAAYSDGDLITAEFCSGFKCSSNVVTFSWKRYNLQSIAGSMLSTTLTGIVLDVTNF